MKKLDKLIKKISDNEDFFFVQIGANDGFQSDTFYKYIIKYNWSGIMVEPIPYFFNKLKKLHHNKNNLLLKNVAIDKHSGTKKIYYHDDDKFENKWQSGIGSFDKNHLLKFKIDAEIKESIIKTITFDELVIDRNNIDLLIIDTEGYDYEIIKSIDFSKFCFSAIYFEHCHLYEGPRKRRNIKKILNKIYNELKPYGYEEFETDKHNTIAINNKFIRN